MQEYPGKHQKRSTIEGQGEAEISVRPSNISESHFKCKDVGIIHEQTHESEKETRKYKHMEM